MEDSFQLFGITFGSSLEENNFFTPHEEDDSGKNQVVNPLKRKSDKFESSVPSKMQKLDIEDLVIEENGEENVEENVMEEKMDEENVFEENAMEENVFEENVFEEMEDDSLKIQDLSRANKLLNQEIEALRKENFSIKEENQSFKNLKNEFIILKEENYSLKDTESKYMENLKLSQSLRDSINDLQSELNAKSNEYQLLSSSFNEYKGSKEKEVKKLNQDKNHFQNVANEKGKLNHDSNQKYQKQLERVNDLQKDIVQWKEQDRKNKKEKAELSTRIAERELLFMETKDQMVRYKKFLEEVENCVKEGSMESIIKKFSEYK